VTITTRYARSLAALDAELRARFESVATSLGTGELAMPEVALAPARDPAHGDFATAAALAAGFAGVLVVARPGANSIQIGALFALMNAVMYGSVTVAVRGMTKTESTTTLLMWQMAVVAVCHSALLVFGCVWVTRTDAALLAASGVANSLAQFCWTKSLRPV